MRHLLIAANWKMQGSQQMVAQWFAGFEQPKSSHPCQVVICPPFPYLQAVKTCIENKTIRLGAQDISDEASGAFTGQVSGMMLKDVGCDFVIVGHSERRLINQESDERVANKVLRALEVGLTPIVCVGETLDEHESGKTEAVVARQLGVVLSHLSTEQIAQCVVAYEPVWAIGTGRTASAQGAQEVHGFLRKQLSERDKKVGETVRIIYGGSVKPTNVHELVEMPDIDGALVGGASLDPHTFAEIITASE